MLNTFFDHWKKGFQAGAVLGGILIFLTLIGFTSEESAEIARIAVPMYLFIAALFGWWIVNHTDPKEVMRQSAGIGITGGVILLLFLAQINRMEAQGIDVSDLYFEKMTPYAMTTLSGVPEEELVPNPDIDPLTGEYPAGVQLRTNPINLYLEEQYALVSIGGLHIGGAMGLALLLIIAVIAGTIANLLQKRVNWQEVRQRATMGMQEHRYVPVFQHWFALLLPLLLFGFFWLTVPLKIGDDTHQLINLRTLLNTSSSAVNNIQLVIYYAIVITGLMATRQTRYTANTFTYPVRAALGGGILLLMGGLAIWQINAANSVFIVPSLFDGDAKLWSSAAVVIVFGSLMFYYLRTTREAVQFESAWTNIMVVGLALMTPLFMNQSQIQIILSVSVWAMFGLGLNIVVGYAGLLDLGYVAFFAIGAYTFAFLSPENTVAKLSIERLNHVGWLIATGLVVVPIIIFIGARLLQVTRPAPQQGQIKSMAPLWTGSPPWYAIPLLLVAAVGLTFLISAAVTGKSPFYVYEFSSFLVAIIVAMIVCGFAGIALGVPILRLRGDYLAIVTLGFGEIISLVLKNLDNVTGGPSGALGLPQPVPKGTSIGTTYLAMFYLSVVGIGLIVLLSTRFRTARLGRTWLAIRSDEDIAQAMGVNLVNVKLLAFSIGASCAGLAGVLFASQQGAGIFPQNFDLEVSIIVLSLVIIGGTGSIPGIIVGSIVLIGLPEILRALEEYRIMAFGLLLIVTMVLRPGGLMPAPPPSLEETARRLAQEPAQ